LKQDLFLFLNEFFVKNKLSSTQIPTIFLNKL